MYRNPAGALVEHTLAWSGTSALWSTPSPLPSAMWTGMNGSAGLTHAYGTSNITAGVYMAVQTGASTLQIYRRTGFAAWTSVSTSTTPAQVVGQPVIEIGITRPRGAGSYERLHIFTRFANSGAVWTRDSDMSALTFSNPLTFGWRWIDNGARTLSTTAVARDTQRAPFGLRGADYALVGNAAVLGAQAPSVMNLATCPVGVAVTAGTRQVCFSGGVPVDASGGVAVVDCAAPTSSDFRPTNGGCPASYACETTGAGSFCTLNGFAPMTEERAPSVDGIIPARIETHNEWLQMRHGFCRTGRELRAQAFTPSAFTYPQPGLPTVAATATCWAQPTY